MDSSLAGRLTRLSDACRVTAISVDGGWTADLWELDEEARARLVEVYRELISPTIEVELATELREAGLDLDQLFFEADTPRDVVTRADMTELAAGATVIAIEGVKWPHLELANVPKRSRTSSEHGMDLIAFLTSEGADDTGWHDGERVLMGSVKHTIADASDLRTKLLASLDAERLSQVRALSELRVFVARLRERGISASRALAALVDFPRASRVTVIGFAALGTQHLDQFLEGLAKMPRAAPSRKHLRVMVFDGISRLHEPA